MHLLPKCTPKNYGAMGGAPVAERSLISVKFSSNTPLNAAFG